MKALRNMQMLLCIRALVAVLSAEKIEKALEWNRDGRVVRRGGPLDMRLGMTAKASGFLFGSRYFIPDIKTASNITFNENTNAVVWNRYYDRDGAEVKSLPPPITNDAARYKTRYYQTVVNMFPSTGGLLNIGTEFTDSLYKYLRSHDRKAGRKEGPQILAALMAMALGAKLDVGRPNASKPGAIKKNYGVNILAIKHCGVLDADISVNTKKLPRVCSVFRFFEEGIECDCSASGSETFLLSKEALLHAFICEYFDECSEAHDFLDRFYGIVRDNNEVCSRCFMGEGEPEADSALAFSAAYQLIANPHLLEIRRTLPFTATSPQIPYREAYFYKRGDIGAFFYDATFCNCVEAALLSALYCFFYDPSLQSSASRAKSCRRAVWQGSSKSAPILTMLIRVGRGSGWRLWRIWMTSTLSTA